MLSRLSLVGAAASVSVGRVGFAAASNPKFTRPFIPGREKSDGDASKLYTEDALSDLITDLPGLGYEPDFKQFSGYLTVSEEHGRNIFYWYVESLNPTNDPVVFWTNGGPGCSGLLGFGTEHGPFYIGGDGTLSPNPHSWNQAASILYVEQPAGVGFSFSETEEDYRTGDAQAAADNLALIKKFFERFPQRKGNEFYIASESYGGHYIPQLALKILQDDGSDINFKGFLVGNPYVDPCSNYITQYEAYYQHSLLAKPTYDLWKMSCSDCSTYSAETCNPLRIFMRNQIGDGINSYALDYPVCTEDEESTASVTHTSSSVSSPQGLRILHRASEPFSFGMQLNGDPPFLPTQEKYRPCAEEHMIKYLNRTDVKQAIHARADVSWDMCTDSIDYSSEDDGTSQIPLYKDLVEVAKKEGINLNMLVFSGDDDSVCSTAGTQYWIYDLGADPIPGKLWKPWTVNDQTAGYVTHFDLGEQTQSTFTFVTVHGAGHEVPAYRPVEALELFKNFLSGLW